MHAQGASTAPAPGLKLHNQYTLNYTRKSRPCNRQNCPVPVLQKYWNSSRQDGGSSLPEDVRSPALHKVIYIRNTDNSLLN
jgi:hypothetical protein